jgi:hypothetical protein
MKVLTITFSDRTWEWMERYLSADELWNLGQYFTAVVEKDLSERRLKALENVVILGAVGAGTNCSLLRICQETRIVTRLVNPNCYEA